MCFYLILEMFQSMSKGQTMRRNGWELSFVFQGVPMSIWHIHLHTYLNQIKERESLSS